MLNLSFDGKSRYAVTNTVDLDLQSLGFIDGYETAIEACA